MYPQSAIFNLIGEAAGRRCFLVDDEIDTAGTICNAAAFLREHGAEDVLAVATHPVFSEPAADRLAASPISKVIVTNTLPIESDVRERLGDKLVELSVASLLGETIRRIHQGLSVGAIFRESEEVLDVVTLRRKRIAIPLQTL